MVGAEKLPAEYTTPAPEGLQLVFAFDGHFLNWGSQILKYGLWMIDLGVSVSP